MAVWRSGNIPIYRDHLKRSQCLRLQKTYRLTKSLRNLNFCYVTFSAPFKPIVNMHFPDAGGIRTVTLKRSIFEMYVTIHNSVADSLNYEYIYVHSHTHTHTNICETDYISVKQTHSDSLTNRQRSNRKKHFYSVATMTWVYLIWAM